MRRDASTALDLLSATSPYRAAWHAQGVAHLLDGDVNDADLLFAHALEEALSAGLTPFVPLILAERGLVAVERGDWSRAEALTAEALDILQQGRFDDYWTAALVYPWGARVACERGARSRAQELVARA